MTTATAAIYARKSTDSEAGVERQVAIATDFLVSKGWSRGPVYADNDVSGATFDRPGLIGLLAAVSAQPRGFDRLVMMNVDRLSRGTIAETLALQQRILRAGVEVWFYQTGARVILTTATDELKGAIDAYGARDFRDQIALKTRAALRKKAQQGHATGQQTFGYRTVRVGDHAEREIVPAQAAVVRRIFELAASGHGNRRIANLLQAERLAGPTSAGWSKDVIARALRNELYRGVAVYGQQTVRAELPGLRVVDEVLWERVTARKEQTRQHYGREARGHARTTPDSGLISKHLLTGLARCWSCGGALNFMGKQDGRRRYYCTTRHTRSGCCANNHGVPMDELDASVRAALYALLVEKPEVVTALIEERDQRLRAEQAAHGDPREAALIEAAALEHEIANLVAVAASGTASVDITTAITERRATVEVLRATPASPPPYDVAKIFRRFAGTRAIDMLLHSTMPAQVRAAIRKLGVTKIVVTPDGTGWAFDGTMVVPIAPLDDFDPLEDPTWGHVPLQRFLNTDAPAVSAPPER